MNCKFKKGKYEVSLVINLKIAEIKNPDWDRIKFPDKEYCLAFVSTHL
ncbi:hypothetical protein SAMN05660413_01401 [Salegentibacter flavus]|uniref:Uncharacterized protein n=1 Tax=Salegentibacter flavus TaxID=287099 RepID=A0A1I4ZPA3_9FLAO|nr:hypothetical protein SAMN05660413_01401 [Salegentibacter flavus]